MEELDDEWEMFLDDENLVNTKNTNIIYKSDEAPKCQDLYISTKTRVLYLNQQIDINNVFWNLNVRPYDALENCIIKKQMKIVSNSLEEFNEYKEKIKNIKYYKENIIKQIDNPSARRIKFKDERKITVGLSRKDILNFRGKIKNAFYNCFAIIIRYKQNMDFKEVHLKVFNTGKLEIPGIVDNNLLDSIKSILLENMQPYIDTKLKFLELKDENVLINSNFNCGFFINRELLHNILLTKYKIETAFDPCSYPGIKCKYYFNNNKEFSTSEQTGNIDKEDNNLKMSDLNESIKYTTISIMIFRTGSCLIVGNCNENVLMFVYDFMKTLLKEEYLLIRAPTEENTKKTKEIKIKKRKIFVTNDYYETLTNKQSL
tara:strand:- start:5245 stop:6363 length:1119 start_codon:yes stop_codon:yes gene_type:complete